MPLVQTVPPAPPAHRAKPHPTVGSEGWATSSDPATGTRAEDFSGHARRRLATLLRFKMLELREAHLARVRRVLEQQLPVDSLFEQR